MEKLLRLIGVAIGIGFGLSPESLAQRPEQFESKKLYEMGRKLVRREEIPATRPGIYDGSSLCSDKKVVIKRNDSGRIDTICMPILDADMRNKFHHPICSFIERYLIEALLEGEGSGMMAKLKKDQVKIVMNGCKYGDSPWSLNSFLKYVREGDPVAVEFQEDKYLLRWETDRGSLVFSIPKRYELICGRDKGELESDLRMDLRKAVYYRTNEDTMRIDFLEPVVGEAGYYKKRGTSYLYPEMNSTLFYKKISDDQAVLLFDRAKPKESLMNLFLEGYPGDRQKITMGIEYKAYGHKKEVIRVDIRQWIQYCRMTGCKMYCKVEEAEKHGIRGWMIAKNEDLGFEHMLYFQCEPDVFDRLSSNVRAKLYTYVSVYGMKTSFAENL